MPGAARQGRSHRAQRAAKRRKRQRLSTGGRGSDTGTATADRMPRSQCGPARLRVWDARRTATRRAAKGHPAQRVAAGASALAHKLDRQTVRQGAQLAEARKERGGAGGRILFPALLTCPQIDFNGMGLVIPRQAYITTV